MGIGLTRKLRRKPCQVRKGFKVYVIFGLNKMAGKLCLRKSAACIYTAADKSVSGESECNLVSCSGYYFHVAHLGAASHDAQDARFGWVKRFWRALAFAVAGFRQNPNNSTLHTPAHLRRVPGELAVQAMFGQQGVWAGPLLRMIK